MVGTDVDYGRLRHADVCRLRRLDGTKARLMELSYQLHRLEDELLVLQKEESFLQMELISASSLRQVEQSAIDRLGMVNPEQVEYLVLEGPVDDRQSAPQGTPKTTGSSMLASISRWFSDNWPLVGKVESITILVAMAPAVARLPRTISVGGAQCEKVLHGHSA